MWAGSAEVSILREALGEALVVFCMTFVGIVGMFKLAERSIERSIHVALLPVPVLGGREKGAARDTRGRGEVAPQYLAATGARRRGPHDDRALAPAARARHESRSASTKSKGPGSVSGMRHSASCGAIDEMRHRMDFWLSLSEAERSGARWMDSLHSSSSGSICPPRQTILRRNMSTTSLDSIEEVPSDSDASSPSSERGGSPGCRHSNMGEDNMFMRAKASSAQKHHAHQVASVGASGASPSRVRRSGGCAEDVQKMRGK